MITFILLMPNGKRIKSSAEALPAIGDRLKIDNRWYRVNGLVDGARGLVHVLLAVQS